MSLLDLLIGVALLAGLARGLSTGLIRQVASVAGFLLAVFLSFRLMGPAGALVAGSLGLSPRVAPLTGFVVVFVAIQVAVFVVIRSVEALVGALKLTPLNRVLGGALGLAKAALALSVVFLMLGYVGVPGEASRSGSVLYHPVSRVLPAAWRYFSASLPDVRDLSDEPAAAPAPPARKTGE